MILQRSCFSAVLLVAAPSLALAQPTTVTYSMAIAGLPIGSATMVMTPSVNSTSVSLSGKAGGPLEIGKMSALAVIAPDQVTVQSQSGSGKSAASASLLSSGAPGSSSFTYTGQNNRGTGKIAMKLAGGRTTALDVSIPDNPTAVRVPVTEVHKIGVIDPLSLLAQFIKPGGTMNPKGLCGKSHGVFTGQARLNLSGSEAKFENTSSLPEGWRAISCSVTLTPVSGHRIDKNRNAGKPQTASLVFAESIDRSRTLLWSLSVPGSFGSFSLTARSVN
ncbi:MAG: hypothetical protein ACKVON_14080 [Beijerinckiaceae bacterium]